MTVTPDTDNPCYGKEISGLDIKRADLLRLLNNWGSTQQVKGLAAAHGLGDQYLFRQAFVSFRKFCMDTDNLTDDLYVLLADILAGSKERYVYVCWTFVKKIKARKTQGFSKKLNQNIKKLQKKFKQIKIT